MSGAAHLAAPVFLGEDDTEEIEEQMPEPKFARVFAQLFLTILVVAAGVANTIAKQIASRPLMRYNYMLSLFAAIVQVPVYFAAFLLMVWTGAIEWQQIEFLWYRQPGRRLPFVFYLVLTALGDMIGDGVGAICTPYVQGPIHSLLTNCTAIFAMLLSMCLLRRRYSLLQCVGLSGVFTAVILGVLPSFDGQDGHTNPWFATVLAFSCIGNASSFVIKELLFTKYQERQADNCAELLLQSRKPLHVFVVNVHSALFQLPLAFLMLPLNQALGQTHGEDVASYLRQGLRCVFTVDPGSCGAESIHQEWAGRCVAIFLTITTLFFTCITVSVQFSSALTTFVALKAIFPVSTMLFAFVSWPLLGVTEVHFLTWVSLCLMVPSIVFFQWASDHQQRRALRDPSLRLCCWPLGRRRSLTGGS